MWLAGFALMVVGVLCLCLSAVVAPTGSWWQGTLDAFGVGFIVGGVIDVLAISGLNRAAVAEQKRLENERRGNNRLAEVLLRPPVRDDGRTHYIGNDPRSREAKALRLIQVPEGQLDPRLRAKLVDFVYSIEYGNWSGACNRVRDYAAAGIQGWPSVSMTRASKKCRPCLAAVCR